MSPEMQCVQSPLHYFYFFPVSFNMDANKSYMLHLVNLPLEFLLNAYFNGLRSAFFFAFHSSKRKQDSCYLGSSVVERVCPQIIWARSLLLSSVLAGFVVKCYLSTEKYMNC